MRSTIEAKLTALVTTTIQTGCVNSSWTCLVEQAVPTTLMNCEKSTNIVKVKNSKNNVKFSRHVKGRLKSVGKLSNFVIIIVTYVKTAKNLADPFTKKL